MEDRWIFLCISHSLSSEPERKRFRMEMSEQEGVAGKRDGTAVLSLIYTNRGTLFSGYDYDNTQR